MKTIIHVNQHVIKANAKTGAQASKKRNARDHAPSYNKFPPVDLFGKCSGDNSYR